MEFHVLNFLSSMETIFNGVSRVKLSFYNGKNLLWSFACETFFLQWKESSMEFHVLNFLSTMERIFYGVLSVKISFYNAIFYGVKLSFYNGNNLLWSFAC